MSVNKIIIILFVRNNQEPSVGRTEVVENAYRCWSRVHLFNNLAALLYSSDGPNKNLLFDNNNNNNNNNNGFV